MQDDRPAAKPPLLGPFDLEPGRAQPVWISVRVPKSAAPGVYKGSVTARAGRWRREFPLSIIVWDFALPDAPAGQTAFGISYEMAADFEGVKLDLDCASRGRRSFSPGRLPGQTSSPRFKSRSGWDQGPRWSR